MCPEGVALRDEMLAWGTSALAEAGHGSDLGQGPRRTRNAANIQEYDLRRQNSSLLGLGFPARAHSFGSHYYLPDASEGFDPSLQRELGGVRRWRAIRAGLEEERHKYLVSNLRTGFTRTEFRSLFGVDPIDAAPEGFAALEAMGQLRSQRRRRRCASAPRSVAGRFATRGRPWVRRSACGSLPQGAVPPRQWARLGLCHWRRQLGMVALELIDVSLRRRFLPVHRITEVAAGGRRRCGGTVREEGMRGERR